MSFGASHPDYLKFSDIYIDESSQTNHRFLLLGGLIVPTSRVADLDSTIREARRPELPEKEMGWTKVSRTKLPAYVRVVETFFDNRTGIPNLDFHSLVIDTSQLDHRRFNEGSREIGFNKEIYQLAMKFGRLYPERLFHCYPDMRSTPSDPNELRLILNRGTAKRGDPRDWPYRRVHFRESHDVPSLQLVDILLGAIAYRQNGHHLVPGASPAKIALSDLILRRAGIADVTRDTPMRGRITIWHRQLQNASRGPRL